MTKLNLALRSHIVGVFSGQASPASRRRYKFAIYNSKFTIPFSITSNTREACDCAPVSGLFSPDAIKSVCFMRRLSLVLIFLISFLSFSEAWTSKTYQLIVVKSVKLMPLSFRNVMYQHKKELLTGCLKPDNLTEAGHRYNPNTRSGYLQDQIILLSQEIPKKIYNHVPFSEIAFDFGRLSHYLSDLNDPLLLLDGDGREPSYAADFAMYQERNVDVFPWVFDGHDNSLLKKGQLEAYVFEIASRSTRAYPLLGQSYYPKGVLVSSSTFDPRSLPFGIASLSYNHSISNTVQMWFDTWKKSNADMSYTPFYSKKTVRRTP